MQTATTYRGLKPGFEGAAFMHDLSLIVFTVAWKGPNTPNHHLDRISDWLRIFSLCCVFVQSDVIQD